MARRKFYDEEFDPEFLEVLGKREILARSNPTHYAILVYNLVTEAEALEERYQEDRKANPVLETTPSEAWLAAEILPLIKDIRARIQVDNAVLGEAIKRFLRSRVRPYPAKVNDDGEQQLQTTVKPFLPVIKTLLLDVVNHQKSLRSILNLPRDVSNARAASAPKKPRSLRAEIIITGIVQKYSNQRIARELDAKRLTPRDKSFKSYVEMQREDPHRFAAMKSSTKRKYQDYLALQAFRGKAPKV